MRRTSKKLPTLFASHSSFVFALLLVFATSPLALAESTEAPEAASDATTEVATAEAEPAAAETTEVDAEQAKVFPVPEGTIDELFEFVRNTAREEPKGYTEEELVAHQRKFSRTVVVVVDKVLAMEPTEMEAMRSHYFKLQSLQMLSELEEPGARELLTKAIATARSSEITNIAMLGLNFWVETQLSVWPTLDDGQKKTFIDTIVEGISSRDKVDSKQVRMITSIVGDLDDSGDSKIAFQLIDRMLPIFQKSEDSKVKKRVARLEGAARRMRLMGKKIELQGVLLDGKPLDWESYRGKVVLVDFWATWCGPCRSEVPNLLEQYEAYHDKGFEVLGVSLDREHEQAEAYIAQSKIPWPTIFGENEEERGWDHPMAVYYNINAIPRAILCDREGRVVSMNARGRQLPLELRKLLGEPVARVEQADKEAKESEKEKGDEVAAEQEAPAES